MTIDYYELLQVSPHAELEIIQAAYRRLSLKYHPDQNAEAGAAEKQRLLNEAYEVLTDPHQRQTYDASRKHAETAEPAAESAPKDSSEAARQSHAPGAPDEVPFPVSERLGSTLAGAVLGGGTGLGCGVYLGLPVVLVAVLGMLIGAGIGYLLHVPSQT